MSELVFIYQRKNFSGQLYSFIQSEIGINLCAAKQSIQCTQSKNSAIAHFFLKNLSNIFIL